MKAKEPAPRYVQDWLRVWGCGLGQASSSVSEGLNFSWLVPHSAAVLPLPLRSIAALTRQASSMD